MFLFNNNNNNNNNKNMNKKKEFVLTNKNFFRKFNPITACALRENLSNRFSGVQILLVLGVICTL